jgi:catechol 2,3-dioxygenase-like lactoylglutathione lyase family enzyme
MKLGHIEIFVKNPLESKKFYSDLLEFEIIDVQDNKFVWLKSGDSLILLRPSSYSENSKATEYKNSKTGIVIYTDNLDKSSEKLKANGLVFKGTDGSEKCLTFTDPDGNWFQLVNPDDH